MDALIVLRAEAAGRNDVRAQRQAHEQVDQQVDERTVGADSGQRCAARKASHDDDIGCVEQQLQDAGCSQRQGKQDDLLQHGAAGQIACPGILCHENTLPPQISDGTHEKTRRSTASDADSIIIRFQVKYK